MHAPLHPHKTLEHLDAQVERGAIKCNFSANRKISRMELIYDLSSFMAKWKDAVAEHKSPG